MPTNSKVQTWVGEGPIFVRVEHIPGGGGQLPGGDRGLSPASAIANITCEQTTVFWGFKNRMIFLL
jgi:hypothetical protein